MTESTRGETDGDHPVGRRDAHSSLVWRMRLVAGCLLLTALAFRQAGGLVVPDTKLDLTADPGGFLSRALHLWDPQGAMGQLQNQAYGYLFPVGPFHWVLGAVGIPGWIVQRLWWSTILIVAFIGMWRLIRAFGVRDRWSSYLPALVFALGPRFMSEVGVTSVEVWPLAMAPWVLLPLVDPRPMSTLRRNLLSGLAVALVGGVNAVATGATLVLPTVWLLTRTPWRRAPARFLGWLGCVVPSIAWWLVPLIVLGRYSPPFLDWIENASVTTAFASPFNALAGVTPWLNFLSGPAGPSWPGGWALVTNSFLIVVIVVVAGLGLIGILKAPPDQRAFLSLAVVAGFVLVTAGHGGSLGGGPTGVVQAFLDGPGAAFRNTHKFELVIRVPLTVGLGWGLVALRRSTRRWGMPRGLIRLAVVSVVVMTSAPGINGLLPRDEGYPAIPGYWREAVAWLDENATVGTTLAVPGASFADFVWGSTKDDPLQALSQRPFVTRDAVPLGTAGTTRWLDDIEADMRAGQGGIALRTALQLAGITHVLVRNDLRADASGAPGGILVRVHQALEAAGLVRAATFGPPMANPPGLPSETRHETVDQRSRLPYPALEIYSIPREPLARLVPAAEVAVVQGGAEDVADVLSEVRGVQATIVGTDAEELPATIAGAAQQVLTDGNSRREVFFGRASDNRSAVLAADDHGRTERRMNDYVADPTAAQTVRAWRDPLLSVRASSSASDANAVIRRGPGYGPSAAIDDDATTAWQSGDFASGVGEWLEFDFATAVEAPELRLVLPPPETTARPTEVRITTENGSSQSLLGYSGGEQVVQVPAGPFKNLRITVTAVDRSSTLSGTGISEVAIPGVPLVASLAVPAATASVDAVLLRNNTTRQDCAWVVDRPLCIPGTGRQSEDAGGLHRDLALSEPLHGVMHGTVLPRNGPFLDRLLDEALPIKVEGSSRASSGVAARPAAVVDGSLGTGWIANGSDAAPTLKLTFPEPIEIGRLQFVRDQYLPASMPAEVEVQLDDDQKHMLKVDDTGTVRWPRTRTTSLRILFSRVDHLKSVDSVTGFAVNLPVGVSEILIPEANEFRPTDLTARTGAPCGYGPDLIVDGKTTATEVAGTVGDLLRGSPLRWRTCDDSEVSLPVGQIHVDARPSAEFLPLTISVLPRSGRGASEPLAVETSRSTSVGLDVEVPSRPTDSILALRQNHNPGWIAKTADGQVLEPIRVNGWQQGWVIPAGGPASLDVSFTPDSGYRTGLLGGLLLLLASVGVAALAHRRPRAEPAGISVPARVQALVVVAGLIVIGGWAGAAAGMVGLIVGALATRIGWRSALPLALLAVAAFMVAANPAWPTTRASVDNTMVQFLVMVALAMCLMPPWPIPDRWLVSWRRPHLMIGRSTR